MSKIGLVSFFSGAGFLDLGFEMTGYYECLHVNEYHKAFLEIYKSSRSNLCIAEPKFGYSSESVTEYLKPEKIQWLRKSLKSARKEHPIIGFVGGPPCPDFSVGGKNRGHEGENGKLSGTYVELICAVEPDFFLFENVKGLYRTTKHREFFDSIKKKLKRSGYLLTERLINSLEYGVAQDRQRIILVGFKKDLLEKQSIPFTKSGELSTFDWLKHTKYSAAEILGLNWVGLEPFVENSQKPAPTNVPLECTVQYWFDRNDIVNHPNAVHFFTPRNGLAKFKIIPEGDDLKKSYKRLHRWRYSPTAAYGNNEVHLHPYLARRINVAEALAIQSLPKEFVIPSHITLSDMFKTIGNGVPFLASKGLAMTIYDFLNCKSKTSAHE